MSRQVAKLFPRSERAVQQMGLALAKARLRRDITAQQMAERAGMSRTTLRKLESGDPCVTLGAFVAVLQVLGMTEDLSRIASDDPLGRDLQDAKLPLPKHARAGRA